MPLLDQPKFLLRTLPLSISILWRFLLVLPLWAVFYIAISLIPLVGSLSLLNTFPVLALLGLLILTPLSIVVSSILSIHPYLIGIRLGLQTMGIETNKSSKRLLKGSIGFGIFEGLIGFLFSAALFAVFYALLKNGIGSAEAIGAEKITDPIAILSRGAAFGTLTVFSVLSSIAVMALRAAILPALANFTVGRSPRGSLHGLLDGFGEKFITMMLLMLMITGISALAIPIAGDAFQFIGLTNMLSNALNGIVVFALAEREISITLTQTAIAFGAIILSVWLFCLQCAGAALSYENRAREIVLEKESKEAARRDIPEDMAALRRSRMPNRSK